MSRTRVRRRRENPIFRVIRTLLGLIVMSWHSFVVLFWICVEYLIPFASFYHKVALVKMTPQEVVYFQDKLIELGLGDGIKAVGVMNTTRREFQFQFYVDSVRRIDPVLNLIVSLGRVCDQKNQKIDIVL